MTPEAVARLASRLVKARRNGTRLEQPDVRDTPATREFAYLVQDAIIAASGEAIGGWKVAAGTAPDPTSAPLPASAFISGGSRLDSARLLVSKVEAEVAVRMARDLLPRAAPYAREEVAESVAALHPALEVMSTRFSGNPPPLLNLADLQKNAAVIVGPEVLQWRNLDLDHLEISLTIGGRTNSVDTGPSLTKVIDAIAWLANHHARSLGGLRKDQLIITGSRVSGPAGQPGEYVVAEFASLGRVAVTL